jgi:hypothetical protein
MDRELTSCFRVETVVLPSDCIDTPSFTYLRLHFLPRQSTEKSERRCHRPKRKGIQEAVYSLHKKLLASSQKMLKKTYLLTIYSEILLQQQKPK